MVDSADCAETTSRQLNPVPTRLAVSMAALVSLPRATLQPMPSVWVWRSPPTIWVTLNSICATWIPLVENLRTALTSIVCVSPTAATSCKLVPRAVNSMWLSCCPRVLPASTVFCGGPMWEVRHFKICFGTMNKYSMQFSFKANNWGMCDNGTGALGCGPQETFKNCADVSVFWGRNMLKEMASNVAIPAVPVEVDSAEA